VRILVGCVIVAATVAIIEVASRLAARDPNIKYFFAVTRLPALAVVVAVLFVYRAFVRWFEKRSVSELDARSALPNLIAGIGLGAIVFALTIGVLSLLGVYRVVGVDSWTVLWPNVVHFGWNFTEGGIFGAAVSGTSSPGLLKANVTGPAYLSGGMFGVEASVVAITICFFVALAFLWRAKAKGQFVRPFWRQEEAGS
jgi:hypothetical protein